MREKVKRPKQIKEIDWIKYNYGIETLAILARLADHVEGLKKHDLKGIMGILNILGDFEKAHVRDFKFVMDMKINCHGKDFVRECVYFAILFADMKLGVDVLAKFGIKKVPMVELKKVFELE